jgi:hypothetical protein
MSFRSVLYLFLLVTIVGQSSCEILKEDVEGSADWAKIKEGGPSDNVNSTMVGFNLAMGILTSLPQNTGTHGDQVNFIENYTKPETKGRFALSSKLEFIQKGTKFEGTKSTLNYLELMEDVVYDYKLPDNASVFGGLGPYFAYGIGGKTGGNGFSESSFGGQDGYKRFDGGLNLMAGYRLPSGFYLRLGYDFGLVNKSTESDFTSRNRAFNVNIGYSIDKLLGVERKK